MNIEQEIMKEQMAEGGGQRAEGQLKVLGNQGVGRRCTQTAKGTGLRAQGKQIFQLISS
jgi:hypothetical protein